MSDRDELAKIVWPDIADKILAAGWRPPARVITTTAEVDALPDRAVAITCYGDSVTIYRDNPSLPPEHFHFLVEGRAATVLYEPEEAP